MSQVLLPVQERGRTTTVGWEGRGGTALSVVRSCWIGTAVSLLRNPPHNLLTKAARATAACSEAVEMYVLIILHLQFHQPAICSRKAARDSRDGNFFHSSMTFLSILSPSAVPRDTCQVG